MPKFIHAITIALVCASCAGETAISESRRPNNGSGGDATQSSKAIAKPSSSAQVRSSSFDPNSTHGILEQSAAVVEGVIQNVSFEYDERKGPRTVSTLKIDAVYAGAKPNDMIRLSMFGGPTDDGQIISTSVFMNFIVGARYIVFLRNGEWFYSPATAAALRVDSSLGREVLADSDGRVLQGLTPEGLHFGPKQVFSEVDAPSANQIRTTAVANLSPQSLTGTLNRSDFKRLLAEAITAEAVEPRGEFIEAPESNRTSWNKVPTAPSDSYGGGT